MIYCQGNTFKVKVTCLEGEEKKEGHHKTEKSHGLREGESQDGVGEQLQRERWRLEARRYSSSAKIYGFVFLFDRVAKESDLEIW